jgi:hypothetical protein
MNHLDFYNIDLDFILEKKRIVAFVALFAPIPDYFSYIPPYRELFNIGAKSATFATFTFRFLFSFIII